MRDSSDWIEHFGGNGNYLEIRLLVRGITGNDSPETPQLSDIPHCRSCPVLCRDPSFCLRLLRFLGSRGKPRDPLKQLVWDWIHGRRDLPGAPNRSYCSVSRCTIGIDLAHLITLDQISNNLGSMIPKWSLEPHPPDALFLSCRWGPNLLIIHAISCRSIYLLGFSRG